MMEYRKDELELAGKYVPYLRYDRKEPFSLKGIGYTIYTGRRGNTFKSPSCRRVLVLPEDGSVIEYAFYYDFDIQHLYDLEHAFVYLDTKGNIKGVESSFHGKFLNSMIGSVLEFEDFHPVLYVQPGKHAFMPSPKYFELVIDRNTACREKAGEMGLLIMPMFEGRLFTNGELNRKIRAFIRENYAFEPAWEFVTKSPDGRKEEEILMPYQELDRLIVESLREWSDRISNSL